MATVLSTLRHKTMRLIDFGRIEKLARDAKHEYQNLEQKVETIEEDGTSVEQSTSVSNSQSRLQDLLAEIESETEHVSLGTHELTRSVEWVPSRSAFSTERENEVVTITANEDIPAGKDVTVLKDGTEVDNPFDDGASPGDFMEIENATDDVVVEIEWASTETRGNTVKLPHGYRKNVSNGSLKELPEAPSEKDKRRTYSVTDRVNTTEDTEE